MLVSCEEHSNIANDHAREAQKCLTCCEQRGGRKDVHRLGAHARQLKGRLQAVLHLLLATAWCM
jgi:hypothetical protein